MRRDVPLAALCSLHLGGAARYFHEADSVEDVRRGIGWAQDQDLPWAVLGGGSNLVVADAGYAGVVIRTGLRGLDTEQGRSGLSLTAAAGEPWDALVCEAVERGWAGLECLAGIPGLVGATPIQNVGAYGQEVAETIEAVQVLEVDTLQVHWLEASACAFAYRDSAFKREPGRFVVLAVRFVLRPDGAPSVRYAELARALSEHPEPSLREVRDTVLRLRRAKSMVLDLDDPNHRSAGSFFTNPIVEASLAARIVERALSGGLAKDASDVPHFPMADGRVKLAAGWLIERAGMHKGLRRGPVGISSAHALALVHHGGGTTRDLLNLAREVRDRVLAQFGVRLTPEPVMLGFDGDPLA